MGMLTERLHGRIDELHTEIEKLKETNTALRAANAELVECLKLWREGYMYATREQLGQGVNHYMDKADALSEAALERNTP